MRLALPGQSRVLRRTLAVTVSFLVLFAALRVGEAIYYANVSAPQISQWFGFTLTSPYLVLDQPDEWREVAQFSSISEGGPLAHAGFRGGDILKDMQIHNFHRSLHQLKRDRWLRSRC